MSVTYSIHLLASPTATDAHAYADVSGPFVPRRGDTLLIPMAGEDAAVCTVTDVLVSLERSSSGNLAHAATVVEALQDQALSTSGHRAG